MKKSSITKKALLSSVLSLFVCFTMLLGTTFAWFTDTVTSDKNTIAAGNLDIELEYYTSTGWVTVEGASDIFDPNALWEPGYTEVAYFHIKNVGSLALKYSFVINVANPGAGTNVYGDPFQLADYIQYSIVEGVNGESAAYANRADAIAAATADGQVPRALSSNTAERVTNNKLESNNDEYFAVVLWMPTTVGNEANYKAGTLAPVVDLGVTVIATQTASEEDAFGSDYDDGIELEKFATGVAFFKDGDAAAEAVAIDAAGYNVASVVIPTGALADGVTKATLNVQKTEYDGNITVQNGNEKETFDITIEGLKDGNTVPVSTEVKIAAGLDPTSVKLYHYDEEIPCTYNPYTGWVSFESATFSPFTVVYNPEKVETETNGNAGETETEAEIGTEAETNPSDLPEADVTEYTPTETIEWGNYGQWSPTEGLEAELDAIYKFACTETLDEAEANKYAYWHCDFVVSLDKALGENEIFLGGNYGSFGWIGFHNGDLTLEANTEIPLLGSVTSNPWTYVDVVQNVGEFICGVGNVGDSLSGATFTVHLRLTNPEDETEFYNIETITYTFPTVVNSGEELQDAVNNGDSNIVLGGDIDLSQGIVIP